MFKKEKDILKATQTQKNSAKEKMVEKREMLIIKRYDYKLGKEREVNSEKRVRILCIYIVYVHLYS